MSTVITPPVARRLHAISLVFIYCQLAHFRACAGHTWGLLPFHFLSRFTTVRCLQKHGPEAVHRSCSSPWRPMPVTIFDDDLHSQKRSGAVLPLRLAKINLIDLGLPPFSAAGCNHLSANIVFFSRLYHSCRESNG